MVIRVGKLSGLVFEIQVAEIVVNRLLALTQVGQSSLHWASVDLAGNVKGVEQRAYSHERTDEEHGHSSVSLSA